MSQTVEPIHISLYQVVRHLHNCHAWFNHVLKYVSGNTSWVHSKKKSTSKNLFLVLQLVTNKWLWKDLMVSGSTMTGILGSRWLSWCFQIPFGPSRYRVIYLWQAEVPKIGTWKSFFLYECGLMMYKSETADWKITECHQNNCITWPSPIWIF